jgi:hypothetical protein
MNVGIELSSIMLKSVRAYVILTLRNKIEYGQPPRFSAHTVLECGLCWELGWYRRWPLEYFHVEISTVRACCGL